MKRSRSPLVLTVLAALLAALVPAGTAAAADPVTEPATVSVTGPKTRYPAGVNASVTIKVTNGGNGALTVRANLANGKSFQLSCGADGVNDVELSCAVYMLQTTRVIATLTGGTNGDATASKKLGVYPNMATRPKTRAVYSGRLATFKRGTHPTFGTRVYPSRSSMCIRHRVQVRRAAGWTTLVMGGCKYPDSNGNVAWRWYGSNAPGYKFRVHAVFDGDNRNAAGSGSFSYFTFK